MFYFQWDESLDTGIDIIDEQHKRIVDYINILHDAIGDHHPEKVGEVLNELVDYTINHFTFEEDLLDKSGYQLKDAHSKVHDAFTDRINKYVERFDAGEDISKQLLSDLRIWLTNHIKKEDANYVPIVQAHLEADNDSSGWVSRALKRVFG